MWSHQLDDEALCTAVVGCFLKQLNRPQHRSVVQVRDAPPIHPPARSYSVLTFFPSIHHTPNVGEAHLRTKKKVPKYYFCVCKTGDSRLKHSEDGGVRFM